MSNETTGQKSSIVSRTCCFTGHRDVPTDRMEYVRRELTREIGEAVADGYRHFISGFAEGVDLLAASVVLELKKDWPSLTLEASIPYLKRFDKIMDNPETRAMLLSCAGFGVWSVEYHKDCFMVRNRKMLSMSSRVIAVYDGRDGGGTVQTLRFAHTMEVEQRVIKI